MGACRNHEFIWLIATQLWLINLVLWRCHSFWHSGRDISITYILAIERSSVLYRVGSISSGRARVMSDWICAEVFTPIFVFQMQFLDMSLLEEIATFQSFRYCADFLGLSSRYILSCQIRTSASSWAIFIVRSICCVLYWVLIAISYQMRCAHHVIFYFHQLRWRLGTSHLLVLLRYDHLSLLLVFWHFIFHMHWLLLCDWLAFWRRFLFLRSPVFIVIWALLNIRLVLDAHVQAGIHVSGVLQDLLARPERFWLVG